MIRGVRCLLPLVLLATGACFATREDVQALHADVQSRGGGHPRPHPPPGAPPAAGVGGKNKD